MKQDQLQVLAFSKEQNSLETLKGICAQLNIPFVSGDAETILGSLQSSEFALVVTDLEALGKHQKIMKQLQEGNHYTPICVLGDTPLPADFDARLTRYRTIYDSPGSFDEKVMKDLIRDSTAEYLRKREVALLLGMANCSYDEEDPIFQSRIVSLRS